MIDCDGTVFRLPIDDIEHAKLVPDWDAVMKGGSGVGRSAPKPIKPGHRPSRKAQRAGAAPAAPPESGEPAGALSSHHTSPGDTVGDAENKEQG